MGDRDQKNQQITKKIGKMTSPVYTLGNLPFEAMVSEAPGYISRDNVTIPANLGILKPGTVLGKITETNKYVPSTVTATDGSEVACAVLLTEVDTATGEKQAAALARTAEVVKSKLVFDASVDTEELVAQKLLQLKNVGISAR